MIWVFSVCLGEGADDTASCLFRAAWDLRECAETPLASSCLYIRLLRDKTDLTDPVYECRLSSAGWFVRILSDAENKTIFDLAKKLNPDKSWAPRLLEKKCTSTYYQITSLPGSEFAKCVDPCDLWRWNATNGLHECLTACPSGWARNGKECVRICPTNMYPDTSGECVLETKCDCVEAGRCLKKPGDGTCKLVNAKHAETTYCEKFARNGACVDTCPNGNNDRFNCAESDTGILSPPELLTGLRLWRSQKDCEKYEIKTKAGCEIACSQSE